MTKKPVSYDSCIKCGSDKNTDMYRVEVGGEITGFGQRLRLCSKCARELRGRGRGVLI